MAERTIEIPEIKLRRMMVGIFGQTPLITNKFGEHKYAWYYHFKHVAPLLLKDGDTLHVTAAALGSKKTRAAFKLAVNNTLQQLIPRDRWECSFMDSSKDPMLWVADYCAWAIQRKWERNDEQSHQLIREKISTEFELWRFGQMHYY